MPDSARIALFSLLLVLSACNDASFAGSSKDPEVKKSSPRTEDGSDATSGSASADPGPEPTVEVLAEDIEIPSNCGAAGATQAKLLTRTVTSGDPRNFVEYEIFHTDCDGKILRITASRILFDMHAVLDSDDDLAFTVSDMAGSGAVAVEGWMTHEDGSDLFGHTGAQWGHYATDQAIEVNTKDDSLRLRIELAGTSVLAAGSDGSPEGIGGALRRIPTFLKFGEATAVTKTIDVVGW